MRDRIIAEIRQLAAMDGKPPGKQSFMRRTGIGEHQWSGVIWARWSDALVDAGFQANKLQLRFETTDVVAHIAQACRRYGRVPTVAEMKLCRRDDPGFPSKGAIASHFPTRTALLSALAKLAENDPDFSDIAALLPAHEPKTELQAPATTLPTDGMVYLLISGKHHKIGRSNELERRIKEVRVALPEAVTLVHAIRTDDPPGIEAYWHRRFADRRVNGEWFKLTPLDVAAFRRRKSQ